MSNWQPIETAPRDGTIFLAWNAAHRWMYAVGWHADSEEEDGGHWDDVGAQNVAPALYFNARYFQWWTPLPEPPSA